MSATHASVHARLGAVQEKLQRLLSGKTANLRAGAARKVDAPKQRAPQRAPSGALAAAKAGRASAADLAQLKKYVYTHRCVHSTICDLACCQNTKYVAGWPCELSFDPEALDSEAIGSLTTNWSIPKVNRSVSVKHSRRDC